MSPSLEAGAFARQIILTEVGPEGQAKWGQTSFLLAAEGEILSSARTALGSSGLGKLGLLTSPSAGTASSDLTLVLTGDPVFRRGLCRGLRAAQRPVLVGGLSGNGYALLALSHRGGDCPCLECFEVLNPKAFKAGRGNVSERLLGAAAATEALLWTLQGKTPLEGKVWWTSPYSGKSFQHSVEPSPKCPARLLSQGAKVTP